MSKRMPVGWILFLVSFLFFWLFSGWGALTDPVESNYALPAKEMVLSGDWLTPHIYGKVWFDKPILIYWLTALSYSLFGFSDSVSRLVPALAGAGGISLIYSFTSRILSGRHGLIAAVILGTTIHYFYMSKALVTDLLLFVASSAGLAYFYMGYRRYKGTTRWYLWMYPCFAIATLAKGPVGFLIPGLILFLFLLLEKNMRELLKMRLLVGIPFFLAMAVPWFYYMYLLHGTEFVTLLLGVHNVLRATQPEHPENNVFYYYPLIVLAGFLPWTGFALHGVWKALKDAWNNRATFQRFLLLWIFSYLLFYSLMATKYPTYLFPLWFPGAILTALYLPWTPKGFKILKFVFPVGLWWLALLIGAFVFLPPVSLWIFAALYIALGLLYLYLCRTSPKGRFFPNFYKFITLCYLLVAAFVLPAAATQRSGIDLPMKFLEFPDSHIGFYQTYSTGSVFYGAPITTKVVLPEELPASTEGANWNLKYVMPLETLSDFAKPHPDFQRNILFLPRSKEKDFLQNLDPSIRINILETYQRYLILEVSLAPEENES